MVVINIYGGPGCGKSVVASELFAEMKKLDFNCALVTEFAKELVYRHQLDYDQLIILGEQYRRIQDVADKVDFVITDSPVLLSAVYADYNNNFNTPQFKDVCYQAHMQFHGVNILLERDFDHFETEGRVHTEQESKELDGLILKVLGEYHIPYIKMKSSRACKEILKMFYDGTI